MRTITKPGSPPTSLRRLAASFLGWLRLRGYSEETVRTWGKQLRPFVAWCGRRRAGEARQVTRELMEAYQLSWHAHRKADGRALAPSSHNTRITALRRFFHWAARERHVAIDPAADLARVRAGHPLPRTLFTSAEVERVLRAPALGRAVGLRDRAILETLYSTGVRRAELSALELMDVDPVRGVVMVRSGKGGKDRYVPIGSRAITWIDAYLRTARPALARGDEARSLFLSTRGGRLGTSALSHLVRRHVLAAGVTKGGACHAFRHTMATLMLDNGADLRVIQEILGHASLGTTQLYTHVAIGRIKVVHAATHPAERRRRKSAARPWDEPGD